MQNLYDDLSKILEKDERVFADRKILKNKVIEALYYGIILKNKTSKKI